MFLRPYYICVLNLCNFQQSLLTVSHFASNLSRKNAHISDSGARNIQNTIQFVYCVQPFKY